MENPENLSAEELAIKKEEMLAFYEESMPYLEAQLEELIFKCSMLK